MLVLKSNIWAYKVFTWSKLSDLFPQCCQTWSRNNYNRNCTVWYCFVELIDQDALIAALREKNIRGAGLDVMTPEPLPLDNPLMEMENVGMKQWNFINYCKYGLKI